MRGCSIQDMGDPTLAGAPLPLRIALLPYWPTAYCFVEQLFQMSPQRSKNQDSSQESGGTCVDRAGWCYRSGRITGNTFAGRSGLVSGDVYEGESAASVDTTEGRDPNQQKPHFERDGVGAPAAG